jgi:O-antigen/teichoic acid export membrane protein
LIKKIYNSPIFNSTTNNAIILLSSIIAIPFVISKLNVEEINVWFLLMSIVAISQGVLFGFNTTFLRFISYSYSGVNISEFYKLKDKKSVKFNDSINIKEFSEIFSLMKYVYIYITIIYFIFILIIGYFTLSKPISFLENPNDGWLSFLIIVFCSSITIFLGFYQIFLEGLSKVALVQRTFSIVNFFGIFFILIVLFYFPSLILIVLIYQIITVFSNIMIFLVARKEIKKMNFSHVKYSKQLFLIVWDSAWKGGITAVLATTLKHVSVIFVSNFFIPSISATFLFTKRLFDIIEKFTMTPYQARIPEIAKYRSRGDLKILIPFLKQTQFYCFLIFLLGYISLISIGDYVLPFISSNVDLGDITLIVLFSFASFFSRWSGITLSISNQSNLILEHLNSYIIFFVYLILFFLLYKVLGVYSFPIAQFVSAIIAAIFIFKKIYWTLNTNFYEFEKRNMLLFLLILVIINAAYIYI